MALVPVAVPSDEAATDSLPFLLATQRHLFHAQIQDLQRLVLSQCRLTGVNPLAQEMAAGALHIPIGKKPRDLLPPKAVKYLHSLFSVKDTLAKRELREVTANSALTLTQAKDFFNAQRSRVKKFVRLSHARAATIQPSSLLSLPAPDTTTTSSSSSSTTTHHLQAPQITLDTVAPAPQIPEHVLPLAVLPPLTSAPAAQASTNPEPAPSHPHLPAAKPEDDAMEDQDKKFVDDVLALMRRETTFAGQIRLMESVLCIKNDAVLNWFIVKEGLAILIAWLSEAATEEQTSVILIIFKVFCHLPLSKAMPSQISSILQAINRLRFYRTSDISNRAKMLLSKWSKLLRSQLLKKSPNDTQKDLIRKKRIQELLRGQSENSEIGFPENILAITENGDEKKPEPKRLRLLAAPYNDSSKRNTASISSLRNKEKRKVLLVEQPDRKATQTAIRVARTATISNSRPISADDIQKAKLRASYMQQKHGKTDGPKTESNPKLLPRTDAHKLTHVPVSKVVNKPDIDPLNMMERLKHAQVRWRTPPEVRVDPAWQVCTGDKSKECGLQAQRIRREAETFYPDLQKIPPNPKDPWDLEMDFDDSLTPEIPVDQPPDTDADPVQQNPVQLSDQPSVPSTSLSSQPIIGESADSSALPEPDLELLAVLLKNPELVFALTSGQASRLSSEQTMAVLDMLKNSGVALSELINGSVGGNDNIGSGLGCESVPTSLPSPTPASERGTWKSNFAPNPIEPALQAHIPINNPNVPAAASPVVSSQVAATSNPYNTVSGFNSQSLSVNMSPQQFMHFNSVSIGSQTQQPVLKAASVNPILSQNVNNHQMMAALKTDHSVYVPGTQPWAAQPGNLPEACESNALYAAYQSRHNLVGSGVSPAGHVVAAPPWDGNGGTGRYRSEAWGQQSDPSRRGESSASWGHNEGRDYGGKRWYSREHERR